MLYTDLMHVVRPGSSERTRGKNDKGAPRPSWPPAASGGSGRGVMPQSLGSLPPEVSCAVQSACNLPGHQGAARKRGSGRVAWHIALHGARRGDRGRKGTERQEARDPAARDEGQGKVREGEQIGGRTRPGGRGREGGHRVSAASRIAPHRAHAGRRAEGQRWQGREGGVLLADQRMRIVCHGGLKERTWDMSKKVPHNRASRPQRAGALDKAERRSELPRGSPPPKVQCAACLRSVMQRGPARTREEGTGRAKEVGHLGGERKPDSRSREREGREKQGRDCALLCTMRAQRARGGAEGVG